MQDYMKIPTEPIGSIPRPLSLLDAIDAHGADSELLDDWYAGAICDTIARFEATGIRARIRGTAMAEAVLGGVQ